MAPSSRTSRTCISSSAWRSCTAASAAADPPGPADPVFAGFFLELRQAKVPVSLREYLTLMEAMKRGVADYSIEDFYYLSRTALVKDERNLDKFDRVFGRCFKGLETPPEEGLGIPEEWLRKLIEKTLTEEEKKQIEALGGWDKLMETLRQRLAERKGRPQGGAKGTRRGGTPR